MEALKDLGARKPPLAQGSAPFAPWLSRLHLCPILDDASFEERVVRLGLVLFVIALAIGADAARYVLTTYYSQIIDARLATGYLTSRPGLYAAPRVLQAGSEVVSREACCGSASRRLRGIESQQCVERKFHCRLIQTSRSGPGDPIENRPELVQREL